MAAPQGLFYFAGIQALLSANFTITPGITPSTATLYIPPQPGKILRGGPLLLTYGGVELTFPDCRADQIAIEIDREGREIWALTVLDRRWKWKFAGRISGYYNVRRGEKLIEDTEKTPRQLATLCLKAMGERRYSVDQLPNDSRPEIEWDYELPSQALAQLCDSLGCQVVLRLDDRVSIERIGRGRKLPRGLDVLAGSQEFDPPERPDSLVFAAGRTRWQADLELEAVGQDVDGEIKPIDQLSYTPQNPRVPGNAQAGPRSWRFSDPPHFNQISQGKARELAKATVFRWYRIKTPFDLPKEREIEELNRILPVEDKQVEKHEVLNELQPRPAWVYGKWWGGFEDARPVVDEIEHDLRNKPKGLYTRGFALDTQNGIVKFNEAVYLLKRADKFGGPGPAFGWLVLPADLRLRTAVSLRDKKTWGWIREEVRRTRSGRKSGTLPRYIRRDDIALSTYFDHESARQIDNMQEVRKAADHYLDITEREYQLSAPGSVSYAGFKPIGVDGAIQQVTWTVDTQGYATTRISRNKEEVVLAPTYKERRFLERLQGVLKEQGLTKRQEQELAAKAQA